MFVGGPADAAKPQEGASMYIRALSTSPDRAPETTSGPAILDLVQQGRISEATCAAGVVLAKSRPDEDTSAALTAYAVAAWGHGLVSECISLLRAGAATEVSPRLLLATVLTGVGEYGRAAHELSEARSLTPKPCQEWLARYACTQANLHLAAGDGVEAGYWALNGLQCSEEAGDPALGHPAECVLAELAVIRRDLQAAANHIAAFERDQPRPDGRHDAPLYLYTKAQLAQIREGAVRAWEVAGHLASDESQQRKLFLLDPAAPAFLVRTALAAGDTTAAAAIVHTAEDLAERNPDFPTLSGAAMQAAGIVRSDADLLEQAAARHRRPWARASALEDAGAVLASRDIGAARDALNQAVSLYKSAGADHDASRADSVAQALRTHRRRRAERPICGWISLTDSERNVARLVAEGLRNEDVAARLYVSRHTVDFHLRSVYRKLDVHSRVQLTRLVSLSPFSLEPHQVPAGLLRR